MALKPKAPMRDSLGQFEQLVLTAIVNLGREAYGTPIYEKVCELAGKRMNVGGLYVTLDRLQKKGLVSSRVSDAAKEPYGKSRTYYQLEADGVRHLQESVETARRIFDVVAGSLGLGTWKMKRAKGKA